MAEKLQINPAETEADFKVRLNFWRQLIGEATNYKQIQAINEVAIPELDDMWSRLGHMHQRVIIVAQDGAYSQQPRTTESDSDTDDAMEPRPLMPTSAVDCGFSIINPKIGVPALVHDFKAFSSGGVYPVQVRLDELYYVSPEEFYRRVKDNEDNIIVTEYEYPPIDSYFYTFS
jgi:hypothetical protein